MEPGEGRRLFRENLKRIRLRKAQAKNEVQTETQSVQDTRTVSQLETNDNDKVGVETKEDLTKDEGTVETSQPQGSLDTQIGSEEEEKKDVPDKALGRAVETATGKNQTRGRKSSNSKTGPKTPEEKEERLRKNREYARQRIAAETKEQREERLRKCREFQRKKRLLETPEEKQERNRRITENRKRKKLSLSNEDSDGRKRKTRKCSK